MVPEIKKIKEFGSDGTPPVALANIVAEVRLGTLSKFVVIYYLLYYSI